MRIGTNDYFFFSFLNYTKNVFQHKPSLGKVCTTRFVEVKHRKGCNDLVHLLVLAVDGGDEEVVADVGQVTPETKYKKLNINIIKLTL